MSYRKGRRFEYELINILREKGYFVIRQAKSSFPDIIAFKGKKAIAIECKVNKNISRQELQKLLELYEKHGIDPHVAIKKDNKGFKVYSYCRRYDGVLKKPVIKRFETTL